MKIRIDPYPFHYVSYSDAPIESKYVLGKWNSFCRSVGDDSANEAYDNYLSLTKNLISIELLNLFRKNVTDKDGNKTPFPLENELRYLVDKKSLDSKTIEPGKKLYFLKVDVIEVISDMPIEKDEEIKNICKEKNIKYRRGGS